MVTLLGLLSHMRNILESHLKYTINRMWLHWEAPIVNLYQIRIMLMSSYFNFILFLIWSILTFYLFFVHKYQLHFKQNMLNAIKEICIWYSSNKWNYFGIVLGSIHVTSKTYYLVWIDHSTESWHFPFLLINCMLPVLPAQLSLLCIILPVEKFNLWSCYNNIWKA